MAKKTKRFNLIKKKIHLENRMVITLRLSLNISSLKWMQNPLYKYKFKQIFKNICQIKAKYKFLLCCCSYLNMKVKKQTHLCRTIGLSEYSYTLMDGDTDKKILRKPYLNQINSIGVYYSIDGSCKKHTLMERAYSIYIFAGLRTLFKTPDPVPHSCKHWPLCTLYIIRKTKKISMWGSIAIIDNWF